MPTFTLEPEGPFSLETIRNFRCGLFAASRRCAADPNEVRLAFPLDRTHEPVGVRLRLTGGVLEGRAVGPPGLDVEAVRRQVGRVLSLEHDGHGFAALVGSDPVLAGIARAHPGFRPPIFYSPFAAAGWLVLTQRLRPDRAARLQEAIARAGGDVVALEGEALASFPRPATLLRWSRFPGVPDGKWARLQAVARAALEGKLEAERLRAMPYAQAHAALQEIHGIGPWTADGILVRGCGLADALVLSEPSLHHAVAHAYRLSRAPDDAELAARAEAWRPYRAWVSVLLVLGYYRAHGGRVPVGRRGRPPRPAGGKREEALPSSR